VSVRVVLPRALAEYADGCRDVTIDVAPGAPLSEVLHELAAAYPALGRRIVDETGAVRRFVNVYVGTDECRLLEGMATPVPEGAVVSVIGSIAGGAAGHGGGEVAWSLQESPGRRSRRGCDR